MRRSTILGVIISILIAGYVFLPAHPVQAATATLPPKSELESAVSRIENFADYAKYYGPNATPITPADPYYREYEYLHSLATKTNILITNYDNQDFTLRNAEAYNIALTAIDQAITGCRYLFGIVRAENATQSSQNTPTVSASNSSTSPVTTTASTKPSTSTSESPASHTTIATTNADAPSNQTSPKTETTTPQTTTEDHVNTNTPVEIPNTGASSSSSILFIVIVSFIAAIAATGIYFTYNHQTKSTTPPSLKKRR